MDYKGETIIKAQWLEQMPSTRNWYYNTNMTTIVRIGEVLSPDLHTQTESEEMNISLPNIVPSEDKQHARLHGVFHVNDRDLDFVTQERRRRDDIDFEYFEDDTNEYDGLTNEEQVLLNELRSDNFADEILYKESYTGWKDQMEMYRTVDKGTEEWDEEIGVVTTLLKKIKIDEKKCMAVVVGPPIMMKFATIELEKMGITDDRILVSLEKNMTCGFGKCRHCITGHYYVCKDGPVFKYKDVRNIPDVWD